VEEAILPLAPKESDSKLLNLKIEVESLEKSFKKESGFLSSIINSAKVS